MQKKEKIRRENSLGEFYAHAAARSAPCIRRRKKKRTTKLAGQLADARPTDRSQPSAGKSCTPSKRAPHGQLRNSRKTQPCTGGRGTERLRYELALNRGA